MKKYTVYSWNINGIRAIFKKGFVSWIQNENPSILCLQEIRVQEHNLPDELKDIEGYYSFWNYAKKLGYSGTAIISKEKPLSVEFGLGNRSFDEEGRVIIAKFDNFTIINCYVPNGRPDHSRVQYKIDFYYLLLKKCLRLLSSGEKIILCGDFNLAHKEIDVAKPKSKKNKTGFLETERACIDNFIDNNFIDVFRFHYPDSKESYTWWSTSRNLKHLNIGWRFDYFFSHKNLLCKITDSIIHKECSLSDHCPISISIKI